MSILFDEAIEALNKVRILSEEESNKIIDLFSDLFPMQYQGVGRIDWSGVERKTFLSSIDEVKKIENLDLESKCYIIWNDESHPVIESIVGCVVEVFDDISAVNFDTWMFIPEGEKVIENIPSGLTINL